MKKNLIICSTTLFTLVCVTVTYPQILFKSSCQSLAEWDQLDMQGDGEIRVVEDLSLPPGFGPNVIELSGKNIILLAKDKVMHKGTLLVLWKDMEP